MREYKQVKYNKHAGYFETAHQFIYLMTMSIHLDMSIYLMVHIYILVHDTPNITPKSHSFGHRFSCYMLQISNSMLLATRMNMFIIVARSMPQIFNVVFD